MPIGSDRPQRIALRLIAGYWIAATIVSVAAVVIFDPSADAAMLLFVPLMPLLPLLTLVGLALSPTVNPVPIGLVLSALVIPSIFIGLCWIARRFSLPPVAVGVIAGLANGVFAAVCFRAMVRSL